MPLSGREVLLVLRAQDRATSVINRLSSTMSRMDRDAIASSMRAASQSKDNLRGLQREVHEVEYQYQRMTLDARKAYMEAGKDSKTRSAAYQKAMYQAREFRVENQRQIQLAKQAAEDQIAQANQISNAINREREAQKQAGRTLMAQGTAAIAAGTSMIYMGAQGVRAYVGLIKGAGDYATAAKYTFTQVDKGKASLKQIEDMGIEVGKKVPVAFEQIQPALYDIWSSIDVNADQSRKLLMQFSKDTVAGQTDAATATRANLAIMNAYGVSVKNTSKVSDFMFQLVRKGVGTYTQFANTIGRVIPSARKAGVSLSDLGGTLTFLTRNGLSTAMAATSAARAFDAMSNPKTAENLKALGVNIIDAQGNLKPIPKIIDMMSKKMKGMSDAERNTFLSASFNRSGGTIQAMRAFNLIFKQVDTYHKRLNEMKHDSGAAETAFKQMADSPQAKLQKLKNEFQALRVELGNKLLPVGLKIVGWVTSAMNWFDHLNPTLKTTIVYAGAVASTLMVVMGAITVVVGGAAILVGSLKTLGLGSVATAGNIGKLTTGLGFLATGLLTAHSATTKTGKAIGILESAAGGAVAGSIFGPWGAAIGGVVGGLGGFITTLGHSKKRVDTYAQSMKQTKADIDSWGATLDEATGKITKQTKALALNKLEQSGMLDVGNRLGINSHTLVNATIGNTKAWSKLNRMLQNSNSIIDGLDLQKLNDWVLKNSGQLEQAKEKWKQNQQAIQGTGKAAKNAAKDTGNATNSIGKSLKKLTQKQGNTGWLNQYVSEVTSAGNAVKGLSKKTNKLDTSGVQKWADLYGVSLDSVVKKSDTAGGRIKTALQKGPNSAKANIHKFSSSLSNQLSTLQGTAGSQAQGIGSVMEQGLLIGFAPAANALSNSAANAVNQAIAAAKAAAKSHSPSKRTIKLGQDLGNGLHIGLRQTTGKNKKAASALVRGMIKEMMKDNTSSSDVLGPIDTMIRKHISGKGATKKEDRAIRNAKKRYDDLMKQQVKIRILNKMFSESVQSTWNTHAEKMPLAKAIKKVNKDLKAAQQNLKDAQDTYNSFQQQISQSVTDFGSMANLTQPTDVFGNTQPWTAGSIDTQLQQKLQTIRQFGDNLKQLLAMGFSNAVYQEVVSMGPDQGSQFAAALIQATPDQINSINSSVAGINTLGNQIGTAASDQLYGAGVQAAQGLVNGLLSQQKDVSDAAAAVAKSIEKAVKKALKIKSPSRVAVGLAANFGGTLADHLYRKRRDVGKAAFALGRAVDVNFADPRNSFASRRGASPPVVGGTSGSANGRTVNIEQYITTQEIDPRKHAADLGWELVSRYNL